MASITIPWNDGPGNIVLTYAKGEGNQLVTVTSDTDCIDHDRQQRVTFVVGDGAISEVVQTASGNHIRTASGNTVKALSSGRGTDEVVTSNWKNIITADGNKVSAHQNSMKVTVIVTQLMKRNRLIVTWHGNFVKTAAGHRVGID